MAKGKNSRKERRKMGRNGEKNKKGKLKLDNV